MEDKERIIILILLGLIFWKIKKVDKTNTGDNGGNGGTTPPPEPPPTPTISCQEMGIAYANSGTNDYYCEGGACKPCSEAQYVAWCEFNQSNMTYTGQLPACIYGNQLACANSQVWSGYDQSCFNNPD